jgi:hypothetical protein
MERAATHVKPMRNDWRAVPARSRSGVIMFAGIILAKPRATNYRLCSG